MKSSLETLSLEGVDGPLRVLAGPERMGNERRWSVELADGRKAVLAQLVEELAADDSLRRRYLADVERWAAGRGRILPALLAWGPRQGDAVPWRLRAEPEGESVVEWIERRAPAPVGEVVALLTDLCEGLAELHASGWVLRDLSPNKLRLTPEGLRLVDVGLARLDILSTRTAASLVLEGSPYTAPELMLRTAVDPRADLYAVGVLAYRMLGAGLPFGDTHALLRAEDEAPDMQALGPETPASLRALIAACLHADPRERPPSAGAVLAVLRGEAKVEGAALARLACQSCGTPMPVGQRLCLSCGKQAVQFVHAPSSLDPAARYKVELRKAKEDAVWSAALREVSEELCDGEAPAFNFLVGDVRMYSREEQKRRRRLPAVLYRDLDHETAERIAQRYGEAGVETKIVKHDAVDAGAKRLAVTRRQKVALGITGGAFGVLTAMFVAIGGLGTAALVSAMGGAFVVFVIFLFMLLHNKKNPKLREPMMSLREGPAALPASDPWVARLAALVQDAPSEDLRALLGRMALRVQHLVDHRAANQGEGAAIDAVTAPVAELVARIESRVARLRGIDAELERLDEGEMVRALAGSRARGEGADARAATLGDLDRLRVLEESRAATLAGLLEADDLLRRAVELGMSVHDEDALHERRVASALAALEQD